MQRTQSERQANVLGDFHLDILLMAEGSMKAYQQELYNKKPGAAPWFRPDWYAIYYAQTRTTVGASPAVYETPYSETSVPHRSTEFERYCMLSPVHEIMGEAFYQNNL